MLTIQDSHKNRFCDGVSRRNFLKIGALGIGSLTFADILRAEAASGIFREPNVSPILEPDMRGPNRHAPIR